MKLLAVLMFVVLPLRALAADISIVDVRRNIPLSDDEPAYKDFYLNAGDGSGLKKNLVVTAVRKLTVRDAAGSQAFGDIEVPVGQLRVIAVFGKVAVAREYALLPREENPMLEQVGLMVGDRVELKGSFVDNKPAAKKKVSENTSGEADRATASVAGSAETPAPKATAAETSAAPATPRAPTEAVAQPATEPSVASAAPAAPAETPAATPAPGEKTAAAPATVH